MRKAAVILLLLLFFPPLSHAQDSTVVLGLAELEKLGMVSFTQGEFEKALALFSEMSRRDSLAGRPHYLRSLCLQSLNKPQEAVAELRTALSFDSTNYLIHYQLARTFRSLRRYNQTIEAALTAIKLRPDFLPPYLDLGSLFLEQKNYGAGIVLLKKVVERDPRHALAHLYLGQCYSGKGAKDSAEAFLVRSCFLEPNGYAAYFALGNFYYQDQRYEEAILTFQRAGYIDTAASEVFHKLGDTHLKKKEYSRALADYSRALRLGDSTMQVFSGIALGYFSLGSYDSAAVYFEKAALREPGDPTVHFNLGVALARRERYEEAIKQLSMALQLENSGFLSNILVQLGSCFYHTRQFKNARGAYEKALAITPDDPEALYNLAVLHDVGLKNRKLASAYYQRYLGVAQEDPTQKELVPVAKRRLETLQGKGDSKSKAK